MGFKSEAIRKQVGRQVCIKLYPELGMCEGNLCTKQATDRHHKDRDTWNNERPNILFLCKWCHAREHGQIYRSERWLGNTKTYIITQTYLSEALFSGLTREEIGAQLGCSTRPVDDALRRFGIKLKSGARGSRNRFWKGGIERSVRKDGYVQIGFGKSAQLEHRAVMSRMVGRPLRRDEIVRAKDGDYQNTHPDNLVIMTRSQVASLTARRGPEAGPLCDRPPCAICSIPFIGRGKQLVCLNCKTKDPAAYRKWRLARQRQATIRWEKKNGIRISA